MLTKKKACGNAVRPASFALDLNDHVVQLSCFTLAAAIDELRAADQGLKIAKYGGKGFVDAPDLTTGRARIPCRSRQNA